MEDEWWKPPFPIEIKINFDGAFDKQNSRPGTRIVSKDSSGMILNCRTMVNNRVPIPFAAVKVGLDIMNLVIRNMELHRWE